MIATADTGNPAKPCVARWTGKDGIFTVSIITWCGIKLDAAAGVTQYPDGVPVCDGCKDAIRDFCAQIGIRQ